MLWHSWINPNILLLSVKNGVLETNQSCCQAQDSKARVWWWLYTMHSNLNLAKRFIVLAMKDWKGLRCCELPKTVQAHSILVWKVDKGKANFDPTRDWKSDCGDRFRPHTAISTIFIQSSTYNEILMLMLEGLSCCDILESIQTYTITILVWKV